MISRNVMNAVVAWLERLLERAVLAILLWFVGGPDEPWSSEA